MIGSDRTDRHAYLLMIHESSMVLQNLLQLLDCSWNDIYIHIDKKAKGVDAKQIESLVKQSNVYFVKRHRIYWGDNSMLLAELELLRAAVKRSYCYYHLLSGADLPIKTKEEIYDFFHVHSGKEFIHFGTESYQNAIQSRYQVYHFFMKGLGRKRNRKLWNLAETYSLAIQRRLHIDRRKEISYAGGAQWFSITHSFVCYIIQQYKRYAYVWRFTQITDELWLQTMCMDSEYRKRLYIPGFVDDYRACVRFIDWKRGNPYVFHEQDIEELLQSECMFARKFDETIDKGIIQKLFRILSDKKDEICKSCER